MASATSAEVEAEQLNGDVSIPFAPVEAQYIRITLTGSYTKYWSIYEVSVEVISELIFELVFEVISDKPDVVPGVGCPMFAFANTCVFVRRIAGNPTSGTLHRPLHLTLQKSFQK